MLFTCFLSCYCHFKFPFILASERLKDSDMKFRGHALCVSYPSINAFTSVYFSFSFGGGENGCCVQQDTEVMWIPPRLISDRGCWPCLGFLD